MASAGYPDSYATGKTISFTHNADAFDALAECRVFHAGTALANEQLVTSGGRVLSVTALGNSLKESIDKAYNAVATISFDGAYFRHDIGAKAL